MVRYFVDTNYFLRFLLKDNLKQLEEVKSLFKKAARRKVFLSTSTVVFFEVYWVLLKFYSFNKASCLDRLRKILSFSFIEIEHRETCVIALKKFENLNLELEDCYHLAFARESEVDEIATFDKKLKSAY